VYHYAAEISKNIVQYSDIYTKRLYCDCIFDNERTIQGHTKNQKFAKTSERVIFMISLQIHEQAK